MGNQFLIAVVQVKLVLTNTLGITSRILLPK